jgi:thiamine transporter ThiT
MSRDFSAIHYEKTRRMNMKTNSSVTKLTLSAVFLALGIVLPFLTGQIPTIGSMLLPMHIPVLICGFVCGWQWGLLVGFVLPLMRSALFSMPPMMPTAAAMAFELAVYGAVTGILYQKLPKTTASIYVSLAGAMIAGRIVWGIVSMILYGIAGKAFGWQIFLGGALLNAVPGIILQLVLIPVIILALRRAKFMD